MKDPTVPADVVALVHGPVATMAHVELLLALRAGAPAASTVGQLAAAAHLTSADGARERLAELAAAALVQPLGGDAWRYGPASARLRDAVDGLAAMYDERPVTLVRLLYERPARPLTALISAFRAPHG